MLRLRDMSLYYPIIYIRGYAMSEGERDETTADPFCGFNLGSTVYRASVNKEDKPKKFIFESPLLRLNNEFGYADVYENGADIIDPDWKPSGINKGIPSQSIVIYRYYDNGSQLLGDGRSEDIENYAKGLSDLILRVRDLVVAQEGILPKDFKCYLVAHSMGGLVVRGFLQNKKLGADAARKTVDKVFTYATPHNGIDMAGINVPSWLSWNKMSTFSRENMAKFLDMEDVYKKYKRVDFIPKADFPIDRIFCMVGTNRADYEVAHGMSRTFAGHGSDGLVKIENASLWGLDENNETTHSAATAYTYRSHSGFFGIVNCEEAYQCLKRFLFGDVRIDLWLQIDKVELPPDLDGKNVEALYQFEMRAGPRGKRWFLTRRVAEEDSTACRTHQQLTDPAQIPAKSIYMSTVFLANSARVNPNDPSLSYAMDIGVRVPDYLVDKAFWPKQHYEGAYLFRDGLIVTMTPPQTPGGAWFVDYGWQSEAVGRAVRNIDYSDLGKGKLEILIPFANKVAPGVAGNVQLIVSAWNN